MFVFNIKNDVTLQEDGSISFEGLRAHLEHWENPPHMPTNLRGVNALLYMKPL